MKFLRLSLSFLIAFALIAPQTSDAQFNRLRDRLKKKVENSVEREIEQRVHQRIERSIDRAIEGAVDDIADKIEDSIEGMIMSSDPPPPIDMENNATGDAGAPFVRYTLATRIQIGGNDMASQLLQRFGAQEQVVSTHQLVQRTDNGSESSQLIDAGAGTNTSLNHPQKTWYSMTFDEMMSPFTQSSTSGTPSSGDNPDMETRVSNTKASVNRTGRNEVINGSAAGQVVMVIEGDYETVTTDENGDEVVLKGRAYLVNDIWQSTAVAGYQTLATFQKASAEAMGAALNNSSFSMMGAVQGSGQLQEAMADAYKELDPEKGLPVRTKTYYVQVPEGGTFNLDDVLAGTATQEGATAQRVMLTVHSEIGNLTTGQFDATYLGVPSNYAEVANPMRR